jgi:hypothetical protein
MKKERKNTGRNGKNPDFKNFGNKAEKFDENKWDFGHREDADGNRKDKKHFGGKGRSDGFKGRGGGEGGEGFKGRGKGGEGFKGGKGGKDKVRPGKVKRMMQRNKKKSFAGNNKKQY